MFGAVQRIMHVALDGGDLRGEISDEQPTKDRDGGKGQGHGTAKIIADIIGHTSHLPLATRNKRRTSFPIASCGDYFNAPSPNFAARLESSRRMTRAWATNERLGAPYACSVI
jgi:hypothetical protein